MWDHTSPIRGWTHSPCIGNAEALPLKSICLIYHWRPIFPYWFSILMIYLFISVRFESPLQLCSIINFSLYLPTFALCVRYFYLWMSFLSFIYIMPFLNFCYNLYCKVYFQSKYCNSISFFTFLYIFYARIMHRISLYYFPFYSLLIYCIYVLFYFFFFPSDINTCIYSVSNFYPRNCAQYDPLLPVCVYL